MFLQSAPGFKRFKNVVFNARRTGLHEFHD